ncbi:TPR repeat-containing protein [Gloeothece citriformis PCC 7424]|uniref:TPR repeat-containing protein n=1 Tax=Gloeothece citriformis (strain PCC 7424) TaxID=65393 RepID=B7KKS1_GLOC7|nr:tetratricopeptide repeat protein [Gloeothece citriformis]ACK71040.1 TPR repeat-containing protein [Gloeothece citriformis PCC 7424]
MNLRLISLITGFCWSLLALSSQAVSLSFVSSSDESLNLGLISQVSSDEQIREDMLIEGMDKGILGDYQGAIEDFTEVIDLYPDSAEAYYNRGIAYSKLGNYDAAIADYNQAISLNSNLAEAYVDRAKIYFHFGNSSKGLKDLQRAADIFKQQGNTIAYNQTVEMIQKLQ